jgi:hypothetical protein
MKDSKKLNIVSFRSVVAASALIAVALPFASAAYAQNVPADLASAARQACIQSAESKGFQVADVVAIQPKADNSNGANVVMSLTRDGQPYKLTCGYSKSAGAVFGDSTAGVTTTTPDWSKLWWLLLPLLGLPLLLLWASKRDAATKTAEHGYEAIVRRHGGNPVDIHSGPGSSYRVTGTLRNGQSVILSGRQDDVWAELKDGGWVLTQYLDARSGYVTQ